MPQAKPDLHQLLEVTNSTSGRRDCDVNRYEYGGEGGTTFSIDVTIEAGHSRFIKKLTKEECTWIVNSKHDLSQVAWDLLDGPHDEGPDPDDQYAGAGFGEDLHLLVTSALEEIVDFIENPNQLAHNEGADYEEYGYPSSG